MDNKWSIRNIIEETLKSSHTQPSPETIKRLTVLETRQEDFMIQNKEEHNAILDAVNKLDAKIDKALEKKAGIWVEKVVIWFGVSIGGGLLAYLGYLLIKIIELKS